MKIDSIVYNGKTLRYKREHQAVFIDFPNTIEPDSIKLASFFVFYQGHPNEAKRPPWDGGFVWTKDSNGKPWVGVACEGHGASSWWPLKDHLSDEPDSMRIIIDVPDSLQVVSNGVKINDQIDKFRKIRRSEWFVHYPINSYNVTVNIGDYVHFSDTFAGKNGKLPLDYYVLRENIEKAKTHFKAQVPPMLECFEKYFGPYPFYKDGYALVETKYWGMEHQGAIAYGNQYKSNQLNFDYIIIHETGHEWFGNHISCSDHAELWIHEAFTTYSEAVFVECKYGFEQAVQYLVGQRLQIANKDPILGPLDVNFRAWQASDMYYKGSWMLHSLRSSIANDSLWWATIRGMYDELGMKNVTTEEVIQYFNRQLKRDVSPIFYQYIGYANLPVFEYQLIRSGKNFKLKYRWNAQQQGFDMPMDVGLPNGSKLRLFPTATFQETDLAITNKDDFKLDKSRFLIDSKLLP